MVETKEIKIGRGKALGVKVELKGAPLVLIAAEKGYVMCGYLNLETAERLGQAAAIVRGVKTFDDVLNAEIAETTSGAKALGVKKGMSGREALERMEQH
ncbi:MAG: DUF1805 domain-containing protein [Candidatus Hadarchaeota archaeon]